MTRGDWLLLGLILATGLALRVLHFNRTTVEHFDEGVYASNLWFGPEDGFRYPQQHLYAPPLVPWLIEWTMVFSGQLTGAFAICPSLVAGLATIALIWWLARRLVGTVAACVASSAAACSGTHILLTRAALTDALMLCGFVAAMAMFARACRTQRLRDYGWFGLCVGLSWWTKYNGWLPLLVAAAVLALSLVHTSRDWSRVFRSIRGWGVAAMVAILVWSPYLLTLQRYGGYAAVATNHRKYLVGASGWWDSLTRQCANLSYIGGWSNLDLLCLAGGLVGAALLLVLQWRSRGSQDRPIEQYLFPVWFCLLGVMTPLYTPYPRLVLPWLAAGWLTSGTAIEQLVRWMGGDGKSNSAGLRVERALRKRPATWLGVGLLVAAVMVVMSSRAWEDRRGLARIAAEIRLAIKPQSLREQELGPQVVYVYGEPALVFQLRVAGEELVFPVQTADLPPATVSGRPVPTYLATGPHAERDSGFQLEWTATADHYDLVAQFDFSPSPLVLLDNYPPRQLVDGVLRETVRLYRVKVTP